MSVWTRGGDRYEALLLLVIAIIVMTAFESPVLRAITIALLGLALTFAFWTSGASRITVAIVTALACIALIVATAGQFGSGGLPHFVFTATGVLLCAGAISTIIRHLAVQTRVTRSTVTGALSVYLLIGLLFAYTYGLLDAATTRGFFAQSGHHGGVDYVYFSYISLTTVGYGDLTAASGLGRMMAVLEALIGQLYLVTIVAVVVANIGRERSREGRRQP